MQGAEAYIYSNTCSKIRMEASGSSRLSQHVSPRGAHSGLEAGRPAPSDVTLATGVASSSNTFLQRMMNMELSTQDVPKSNQTTLGFNVTPACRHRLPNY